MPGFGSMLRDYLEYYKISQSEFSDRLGISQKHMNEIINGKTKISPELMVVISLLTDIDVKLIYLSEHKKEIYNLLTTKYKSRSEINKMLNSYHLNEMVKNKWIKLRDSNSFTMNYIDLEEYMGVNNIDEVESFLNKRYLFKKTTSSADNLKIFLWCRHCDIVTKGVEVGDYDSSKLYDLIKDLQLERMKKYNKERLIKLFNKYGIILCIENALKGSKVRGCIKVKINTPAIYMTTYLKEKSSFYYTLYHELMHLKKDYNKLKNKAYIEEENDEDEMDNLAKNLMIDENIYEKIKHNLKDREIISIENNIPLCFLYSRLAHDGLISYSSKDYQMNKETIE